MQERSYYLLRAPGLRFKLISFTILLVVHYDRYPDVPQVGWLLSLPCHRSRYAPRILIGVLISVISIRLPFFLPLFQLSFSYPASQFVFRRRFDGSWSMITHIVTFGVYLPTGWQRRPG